MKFLLPLLGTDNRRHYFQCFMPKNELLMFSLKKLTVAGSVWIRQGTAGVWSNGWMYIDEV